MIFVTKMAFKLSEKFPTDLLLRYYRAAPIGSRKANTKQGSGDQSRHVVEPLAAVVTAIPASEPRRPKTPFWIAEVGRVAGRDDDALVSKSLISGMLDQD